MKWLLALWLVGCGSGGGVRVDGGGVHDGAVGDAPAIADAPGVRVDAPVSMRGDAAVCTSHNDCVAGDQCVGNHCTPACADADAGTVCNAGNGSPFPPQCCTAAEHCCTIDFQRDTCRDVAQACPAKCARSLFTWCETTDACVYSYDPAHMPFDTTCQPAVEGSGFVTCAPGCDAAHTCGTECCGSYATCVTGCCVASMTP